MATQSTQKSGPAPRAGEGKPGSDKAANSETGEHAPAKSKSKLIIIIVAVLLVLASAGAGAWFMLRKAPPEPATEEDAAAAEEASPEDKAKADEKEKAAHAKPPIFVNLEPFTVNLQRDENDHYLQITMVIKASAPATGDAAKLYMPQLRNNILLLLSSKHVKDLESVEAKQKLAAEITAVAKTSVDPSAAEDISGIFFTSFLIQ